MADLIAEIAVSEAKFRQQTRKVFDDALKATADFERQANAKLKDFGKGFAGSEMTKAQAREYDRLKRQLDPLYAASKRYEAELQRLNRAQQIGAINSKQYDEALQRINAELAGSGDAMAEVERTSNRFGSNLSNIGFQVGDFATQVGAGTSATQALGQQLPQLLGGFGAIGAVAGAAAAILIPLGAALFNVANDSETLDDKMEGLRASTDAMAEAADRAATPLSDLREEYGGLADEIARANSAQAFFTAQLAKRDLMGVAGKASRELFGGSFQVDRAAELQGQAEWEQYGLRVMKMAATLKVSREEARRLFEGLDDLGRARGPEEVVRITDDLLALLRSAPNATEVFASDIAQLAEIGQAAADMVAAQQAGGAAIRASNKQLLESYDKTTQALVGLTDDLDQAEKARAEAASRRNAQEVAQWDLVIGKIKETIAETKKAAAEEDALVRNYAQRQAQAYQQYATTRTMGPSAALSDSMGPTRAMLKQFEGWQPTGKWDVNAYRAGYGSSTVTLADGSIQKITAGMAVSREDAERDLDRRILGYFEEQRRVAGPAFDTFTPDQKAALASIQHNYGSIPDRLKPALTTGDAQIIAAAIAGLAMDYTRTEKRDGSPINYNRRMKEAAAFGDVSAVAESNQEEIRVLREQTAERDRLRKAAEEYGKTLERNLVTGQQDAELSRERASALQAIEAAGLEGPAKAAAIAEVNGEYEKQRLIFTLIEDAKRRQVDLDTQMTGSTMTYAQAIAALGDAAKQKVILDQQQAASLDQVAQRQAFYNDLQTQMKDGLIDSIIAGESFADVLANVADMLAKAALQAALFNEGPFSRTGGGGGLMGGFINLLSGKRAMGGPVSAGGAYLVGERGPEIIVPRSAGTVIPNHQLGGGGMVYSPTFHIGGNVTAEDLAAVRQESLANYHQMQRTMPAQVQRVNRDPLRR